MDRQLRRLLLLLWLGTFIVLLAANWRYCFANPFLEQGDTALNALQIDRAKTFDEIHGNYSRFRFNHPGPAFFYVYAFAEWLLCDRLPTGLAPYNAHTLAGLALQSGFFALALTLASAWVRHRLFLPLCAAVAAAHFGLAGDAFTSIWPPHVLLMPFLAFCIACTSLACGRGGDIVWAVLAGSFLVHGHVAQPMFVGVLFVFSYGLLLHRAPPASPPWRNHPRAHLIALGVAALFAVPLLLDLNAGANSNLAQIMRHLHDGEGPPKKFLKILLYEASFLGYARDQDAALRSLSPDSLSLILNRWPFFAGWIALLASSALALRWQPADTPADEKSFLRTAAWAVLLLAGLGLAWGRQQAGLMYAFNSHFFYAIPYLGLLPLLARVARRAELPPPGSRWLEPGMWVLAAGLALPGFHHPATEPALAGLRESAAARAALAGDPHPDLPVVLVFGTEGWAQAAIAALTLQRAGRDYYVDHPWWFMFSRRHTVPDAVLQSANPPVSIWRLVSDHASSDEPRLGDRLHIRFSAPPLAAQGGDIDFSAEGDFLSFAAAGFANRGGRWTWLTHDHAMLQFEPGPANGDVWLDFTVTGYGGPAARVARDLRIYFNATELPVDVGTPGHLLVRVPQTLWRQQRVATLRLHLPGALDPNEPGLPAGLPERSLGFSQLLTRTAP